MTRVTVVTGFETAAVTGVATDIVAETVVVAIRLVVAIATVTVGAELAAAPFSMPAPLAFAPAAESLRFPVILTNENAAGYR